MADATELMALKDEVAENFARRHRLRVLEVEDAVQLSIIACLPYPSADVKAYFYTCVARKLAKILKRNQKRWHRFEQKVAPILVADAMPPITPEETLLLEEEENHRQERFAYVIHAINLLDSSMQRSTLKLHRVQGKSIRETARITGLSVHTAKRYDTLGIRQVREQIRMRA